MWNVECGMWNVECGMWNVEWRVMTFRTRPSTYRIDEAPTSRAKCRKCKRTLAKGDPRVTTTAFVMPGRSTVFARCAPCCIDKKFAAAVLSVYKRTDLVPADPAIDSAVLESVRIALCGVGLGRPVPPEHALGDSNSKSLDTVRRADSNRR